MKMHASTAFTLTSLTPVPLLLAAALWSGVWAWIALLYLTAFAFILDALIGTIDDEDREFPAADALSVSLAVLHFVTLGAVVWAFGQGMSFANGFALFMAAGLFFGQIGNANAHELIHRGQRSLHSLGKWVYISLLFGHHTSAHTLVHHRYLASQKDPNTAKLGESFYTFLGRAWVGSFRAGLAAETGRYDKQPWWKHPYTVYFAGALVFIAAAALLSGVLGCLLFIALAFFAQIQLLLSDYVQHYGLTRDRVGDRLEPVGPQHSWNAPHLFTSHMMLHAPRHSAHHTRPSTTFNALDLPAPGEAPLLPFSLPTMSVIALVPPLWQRVINPRLAYWQTRPLTKLAA